jgi:GDP-4-dehydro-6-deoxy-D-mannose reductase
MDGNVGGTINVFEGLRSTGVSALVVVACSSAEYGLVASKDLPVKEDHALAPLHPYGVSKVAQDLLAAQYFVNYKLPTVRIRIFNTTGPSKVGDVCSDLTRRAAEIELGLRSPCMMVGNLTPRRTILDVRDMVHALWVAAERGEPGDVYNVGSNSIYSIQELLDIVRAKAKVPFTIEQDPALLRPSDEPVIAGDIAKFKQRTGWTEEIDADRTLQDMLEWWREELGRA